MIKKKDKASDGESGEEDKKYSKSSKLVTDTELLSRFYGDEAALD